MIERSTKESSPQREDVDFAKTDRILDAIETTMMAVASEHRLREMKIQRWRWDQPEILMSWTPFRDLPQVGKNIRSLVKQDGHDTFRCSFESNAWSDVHEDSGSFIRYWDHFPVGSIPQIDPGSMLDHEAMLTMLIREHVERAYERVSDSGRIMLSHAMQIFSNGEAHTAPGSAVITANSVKYQPVSGR